MNFLDAQIAEKGGDLIAKLVSMTSLSRPAKAKVLKDGDYVGKTVVLGIRQRIFADSQCSSASKRLMTSKLKFMSFLVLKYSCTSM